MSKIDQLLKSLLELKQDLEKNANSSYAGSVNQSSQSTNMSKEEQKANLNNPYFEESPIKAKQSKRKDGLDLADPEHPFGESVEKASVDPKLAPKDRKVKELQAQIDAGAYKPDPKKIADKMVDIAIKKSDECIKYEKNGQWALEKTSPQSKKLQRVKEYKEMADSYRKDLNSPESVMRPKDLVHAEDMQNRAEQSYSKEVDRAKRTQALADIRAAERKKSNKPESKKRWFENLKVSKSGQWSLEKRCWEGYEPTPGKKAYEKGSCQPVGKSEEVEVAPKNSTNKKTYQNAFEKASDPLKAELTPEKGVSQTGIEVRRADPHQKGIISHGYGRITSPEKHAERAKQYAKDTLEALKQQPKPKLTKSYDVTDHSALADNEIEMQQWDDGLDFMAGKNVDGEIFDAMCEKVSKSLDYEELEKKEWSPKAEHKSKKGGLTEAGRKSYNKATGGNLKPPQPGGGPRKRSFCARNKGQLNMHNIDCKKTPEKRACKARRRWKC